MNTTLPRVFAAAAAGITAIALAGACSSTTGGGYGAPAPAAPTTSAAAAPAAAVMTAASPTLGPILVDAQGHTLYRFDKDTNQPPTSSCTGACATTWPPVPATTDVAGIDSSLIGSVTRADGSTQLTIKGWPVYRFAGDNTPGATNGEGVKNSWWAIAPTGAKITTPSH